MTTVRFQELAEDRLYEVRNEIVGRGHNLADFESKLGEQIARLLKFPRRFRPVPEFDGLTFREFFVWHYRFCYHYDEECDRVSIMTIWRNWEEAVEPWAPAP